MGMLNKLAKRGMFGLAGMAASKKGMLNKIARKGGLGIPGMMLADRQKQDVAARGRPMVEEVMVAEEAPAGAPMMRKGGKVKKMAKGGSTASKRADGCAVKGKTKGRFV
jgi:hypothetical protein